MSFRVERRLSGFQYDQASDEETTPKAAPPPRRLVTQESRYIETADLEGLISDLKLECTPMGQEVLLEQQREEPAAEVYEETAAKQREDFVVTARDCHRLFSTWVLSKDCIEFGKGELKELLSDIRAPEVLLDSFQPPKTRMTRSASVGMRSSQKSLSSNDERLQAPVDLFLSMLRDRNASLGILRQFLPKIFFGLPKKRGEDLGPRLSLRGVNPLHCLAVETNFDKKELKAYQKEPYFERWVTEPRDEDGKTPFHLMCLYQNVGMIRFFLEAENSDLKVLLAKSGLRKTEKEGANALVCLGYSVTIKESGQENLLPFFEAFVELYGAKSSQALVLDSEDLQKRKFMNFVALSQNPAFIERVTALMSAKWK